MPSPLTPSFDPWPLDTFPKPRFSRPLWAEVDLDALRANLSHLSRELDGGILAVIKANAYGHGAVPVARELTRQPNVRMLGVASVDEGIELREAGIDAPILLLSAILPEEAAGAVRHQLMPTLCSPEVARALNDAASQAHVIAPAHWKIDTGMGRIGVPASEAASFQSLLAILPNVRVEGVYTHFSCADEEDETYTRAQLELFEAALQECGLLDSSSARTTSGRALLLHAANSAGALRFARARFDLSRLGIVMHGVRPSDEVAEARGLEPVMSLHARVTFVKDVLQGAALSYGATWRAPKPCRIATVPIGYADGYPRRLSNRAQVLVRGQRLPVVGRVTMDQILVDVSGLGPNIAPGELVTLWGRNEGALLPVEEVAWWAETIPYELLCGIAPRVPRVYLTGH